MGALRDAIEKKRESLRDIEASVLTSPKAADAMVVELVAAELGRARQEHAPMNSAHEAYSVILEELDEFWDEVKKKSQDRSKAAMAAELGQIAAMAIRAINDLRLIV